MIDDFEEQLFRAYFRRFGKNADCPSQTVDYVEINGEEYAVLSNIYGILAIYRLNNKTNSFRLVRRDSKLYETIFEEHV